MAEEAKIGLEMAATYSVTISGFERTRRELEKLQTTITSLRKAQYSPEVHATDVSNFGGRDVFVSKLDKLEGRVQGVTEKAMAKGMALGRRAQGVALNAAETPKGLSGKPKGRHSTGRNVTGHLINSIHTNVETARGRDFTQVTGWHGWGLDEINERGMSDREKYFAVQEKGNNPATTGDRKPITPANSLGQTIPLVREYLRTELGKLR